MSVDIVRSLVIIVLPLIGRSQLCHCVNKVKLKATYPVDIPKKNLGYVPKIKFWLVARGQPKEKLRPVTPRANMNSIWKAAIPS